VSLALIIIGLNGIPNFSANRFAKFGTNSGCLNEGIQVNHSGKGSGFHLSIIISYMASTNSSLKLPIRLSSTTIFPQPASPHRESTLPVSACKSGGILYGKSYSGKALLTVCFLGKISNSECFK